MKLSPGFVNGIKFILRLIFILIGFGVFSAFSPNLIPGGIPVEITVIISAIVGTIFALSTTTVIQNFIAGIYLIATRPFKIGDYVRLGDQEGIVSEISLNHTKLELRSGVQRFVSNQAILSSKIVTFTVEKESIGESKGLDHVRKLLVNKEYTRYAYTIELPKENPERTKRILQEVSEKFANVFDQPPKFITTAFLHKVIVSVILEATNPYTILRNKESVTAEIYTRLF